MSPRSTFQSCGSSSRLVLRRMRPIGVTRGSFVSLNNGLARCRTLRARLDERGDELVVQRVVRVDTHGAELQHREGLRHPPDARLPEEDGTGRCQLQQRGDDAEKRRQEQQQRQAAGNIQPALDRVIRHQGARGRAPLDEEWIRRVPLVGRHRARGGIHVRADREAGNLIRIQAACELAAEEGFLIRTRSCPARSRRTPSVSRTSRGPPSHRLLR